MQQAKRVAKNTGILYAQMGITVFMSLYATRLVLAALGAEDFGIFNVVGGAIAMLTFLNAAMTGASQRFMSFAQGEGNAEKQKSIFNISVVLHFLIAIVVVLLLEVAGYFLFGDILKIAPDRLDIAKLIFQFLIASTFFTIISVPYDAVINAHENMLFVAILRIAEVILKLVIAFYITYTSFDKLLSFGLLMASLSIFLLVVRQIYCFNKYEEAVINIKKYYSKPLFKEMTSFASWSFLGASSGMIANYGQGIVLNMFFGTIVNAAQGIANQVSGQLGVFAGTMQKALNPMIAKSEGAGNRALMLKASMVGSKTSFFLLMITFIPVLIEMPYIFGLWLKDVPEYAVIFCRLLLLRNLIDQLYITLTSAISAEGNIRKFQIVSLILNFLPLIITYLLFEYNYPAYILYVVFIIFSLLSSLVVIYFTKINCELPILYYLKNVVVRSVSSFLLVLIVSLIPFYFIELGFIRLLAIVSTTLISFLVTVWFVGFTSEERIMMKKIIEGLLIKVNIKGINGRT